MKEEEIINNFIDHLLKDYHFQINTYNIRIIYRWTEILKRKKRIILEFIIHTKQHSKGQGIPPTMHYLHDKITDKFTDFIKIKIYSRTTVEFIFWIYLLNFLKRNYKNNSGISIIEKFLSDHKESIS